MASLRCSSISSVASDWLQHFRGEACVLAQFDRVVNIRIEGSSGPEVLALCSRTVGNGPLNLVLEPWPEWAFLTAGSPVVIRDRRIRLGGQTIECAGAQCWNPSPDWVAVREDLFRMDLVQLQDAIVVHTPRSGLLAVASGLAPPSPALVDGWDHLDSWWRNQDVRELGSAVAALAGLGEGLTPAGDDFLCGLVVAIWATQQSPQVPCGLIAERAGPLTTELSAALLRRAALGQVNAAWMGLLLGLRRPLTPIRLQSLVTAVVAAGHSSGADMLAGFLWLLQRVIAKDCRRTGQCA